MGLLKRDMFSTFLEHLRNANVCVSPPFTSIQDQILNGTESYLDFYDTQYKALEDKLLIFLVDNDMSFVLLTEEPFGLSVITYAAETQKIAVAGRINGKLVSQQKVPAVDHFPEIKYAA